MRTLLVGFALILELTALNQFVPAELWQIWQQKVAGTTSSAAFQQSIAADHKAQVQPVKTGSAVLKLGAKSVYAIDIDTAQVLYSVNSQAKLPIASITKLAAALVVLRNHTLEETVTVKNMPSYPEGAQLLGLSAGQKFKLSELLKAAVIESDNDAIDALALHTSPTLPAFAAQMNRLMQKWGITDVYFDNASGLGDKSLASAEALAKLGRLAILNPDIAKLAATATATVTDTSGASYQIDSSNDLLPDSRFSGIKTGYTELAGQSFVGLATINGHRVITVVLNSPDRFGETKALADWIQNNYTWQ